VRRVFLSVIVVLQLSALLGPHSKAYQSGRLDPARKLSPEQNLMTAHAKLPEQYIWTAGDAAAWGRDRDKYSFSQQESKTAPHYFRYSFTLIRAPLAATLYVAGPRTAKMYVNGELVDSVKSDLASPLGMHVFATDISRTLISGSNTLALEVVRGRGIVAASSSRVVLQQAFGEVLVAKIVPATYGISVAPLATSSSDWKSTLEAPAGWERPGFDDSNWTPVQTLGPIESSIDMFQWNADAGLYDWPGYQGISPFLRQYVLKAENVDRIFEGRSHFENLKSLTDDAEANAPAQEFAVRPAAPLMPNQIAPWLLLDFGREVVGRLELQSDCDCEVQVALQYGESEEEAMQGGHYLGSNLLRISPHGIAYGPKSGFRYARVWFIGGSAETRFKVIRLDGIYYPVKYQGSFDSSDPLLNQIWETGAYTMHLCMQDDIWDAPKRDRGRWVGDLDVGGRVVNEVFADRFLMEDTFTRLIGDTPVEEQVNSIPGYSALWITALADYYRHTGAKDYLAAVDDRMVELLNLMDSDFDEKDIFVNRKQKWLFVDWSPDLFGDTPETRHATEIEIYRAYREAGYLLRELGHVSTAQHYEGRAAAIRSAINSAFYDARAGTYGPRWQTNAAAILGGVAGPEQYQAIWKNVLSSVGEEGRSAPTISPYYSYYVVTAMAEMGHREEALQQIRKYWGGMLAEGATSFWESYDLRWPKNNFHLSLQADGTSGFFVSLAHGWSSGATAWLMEQVLGISPTESGFRRVTIRPDLIDLKWAKGSEPTPHGPITVALEKDSGLNLTLELPASVEADVLMPIAQPNAAVLVNGIPASCKLAEDNTRARITLNRPGHYEIRAQ